MAAEAAELSDGHMVRNVVLFSVLVYELVGPTLAKLSLTAAGEIIPEGRTSARTTNKPEEPVSVESIFPINLTAGDGAFLHYKSRCTVVTLCSGFLFALYFSTISSFSASTVRVEPETRVPSMIFSAAGSSTALRMVRRRSRAPNLPPWLLCTSAASAAGV